MDKLSQRDTRWVNEYLGDSYTTIGDYGCTITALAMLAGLTPTQVNIRMKSCGGFQYNLVIWSKIVEAIPWLKHTWRQTNKYDNDAVKAAINQAGGCLVEVNGAPIGGTVHWVLYIDGKLSANNGETFINLATMTDTEIEDFKYDCMDYATNGNENADQIERMEKALSGIIEQYKLMGDLNAEEAYETLINNDLSWRVVQYTDGSCELKHESALSSILECGADPTGS